MGFYLEVTFRLVGLLQPMWNYPIAVVVIQTTDEGTKRPRLNFVELSLLHAAL